MMPTGKFLVWVLNYLNVSMHIKKIFVLFNNNNNNTLFIEQ